MTNLSLNEQFLKTVLPPLPMNSLFDPEFAQKFATETELEPLAVDFYIAIL